MENEVHFVLECPLYISIESRFPSLFQNAVLSNLKSPPPHQKNKNKMGPWSWY